ncbi:PCC domain-containing protein [Mucilaginibacter sp. SG564]|uniref:PCC domain-containing protein n=1 Tax=unclassified Mucilaginibacter TaxID=2617802 RepID=UPI00352C9EEF
MHANAVLGKCDGAAHGGHLLESIIHPTLEVIITEVPAHLKREMDKNFCIPLIKV